MAIAPGQQVGNYRVQARLGVGGVGVVYLAEHPIIGKKVALKVIHRELSANREVIGRFYQEARAVNLIGNEHIVEVHDFGQSPEGDLFFVMEYLDGKTLAQVLTRERLLDVPRALHVSAQIADALAAAHTAGIIHRDLKPDNVMLVPPHGDELARPGWDRVKILDFGIAKVSAPSTASPRLSLRTQTGVALGTPEYMSPEQCVGTTIDGKADVYSLGVMLFEMLTGRLPFLSDLAFDLMAAHVRTAPPALRDLAPGVSVPVAGLVAAMLSKDPVTRPTMAEVVAELEREAVLGLDVETTLAGRSLCLMQIATRTHCYLIDALEVADLSPLTEVLASARIRKVIHNASFERSVLGRHGLLIDGVVDTLEISRARYGRKLEGGHSLKAVCARELGLEMSKEEQTSDWARRPLSERQIRYAALDAEVLLQLYDRFMVPDPGPLFAGLSQS